MSTVHEMRHGEICCMPHDRNGYFGWPSITRMDDGTLIAAASGFRYRHICPWGATTLFFSRDDGETWSEPHRAPVNAPHGPILMKNGSLLYLGKQFSGDPTQKWGDIVAAVSIDYGVTWKEIGTVPVPEGRSVGQMHEAHVCEMPDGRLIGVIRMEDVGPGTTWQTESTDGGRTWSIPQLMPVSSVPAHLVRHSSGVLICTYGYRHQPWGQHVIFSKDDGKTWIHDMPLRDDGPDGDLGYPATVELGDGSLLTVYYQKAAAGENTSILYTRWKLPEEL